MDIAPSELVYNSVLTMRGTHYTARHCHFLECMELISHSREVFQLHSYDTW